MDEKVTYYIGNHNRWLHEKRSKDLNPHTHRFVSNIDAFRELSRDIEIINLGPVETTREKVRELRARGFKDIKF